MTKLNMEEIYKEFNITDNVYQKAMLCELVFVVVSGKSSLTKYTSDKQVEVRKAIFGDMYGTLIEKIVFAAGYSLKDILVESLGLSSGNTDIFNRIIKNLEGKQIVDGIQYNSNKDGRYWLD